MSSFIILFLIIPLNAETDIDPLVTLHVLSKQVRLLKSGAVKKISITTNNDSIIRDETSSRSLEGKTIAFLVHGGILNAYVDSSPVTGPCKLILSSGSGSGLVVVTIDGQARTYPLPMAIQYGNNDLRFHVRERLDQYVVDSALAEYSGDFWKEKEGILALAHVIRARYFYGKKSQQHGDADFCDLTHCQVYRGRIKSAIQFNDDWVIDHARLQHNLFFHSRCGGRTGDPGVFSGKKLYGSSPGTDVKDWLYREGVPLCSGKDSHWERNISHEDLGHIFFPGKKNKSNESLKLQYDLDLLTVHIKTSFDDAVLPVETFRLKINRVRGWNFIRSNNFAVSETVVDGKKHFRFKGEGLGHGVGLCQHGAMALSRLGYNRYEILEHYYPDIQLVTHGRKASRSPYCSYCLFDVTTGKVILSSLGPGFLRRNAPSGSIFKLIVSLYIASERPDIFNDYTFNCTGRNMNEANLPERCWKPNGHGMMKMSDAIPNSCNFYFASLYKIISEKKFRVFCKNFCSSVGIKASLPEISSNRQWAELLAGLDFRVSFSVSDFINIARYIYCGSAEDIEKSFSGIKVPYQEKMKIFQGLQETFTRGTASELKKRSGASCNYLSLENANNENSSRQLTELWGKTSTVIDGTNKPVSYGIFLGGNGREGVIVILRKATGNMASRWARRILSQSATEK